MKLFVFIITLGILGYFILGFGESSNSDDTLSYETYLSEALSRAYNYSNSETESYSSSWDISEILGSDYTERWIQKQETISGTQWDQDIPSLYSTNKELSVSNSSIGGQDTAASEGNFGDPGAVYVHNTKFNQNCSGLLFDPCIILDIDTQAQGGLADIVKSYNIDI